jgi:hypothetical protein
VPISREKPYYRPQKRARKSRAVPGNNVFSSNSSVPHPSSPFQVLFSQPSTDPPSPSQNTPWKRNDKRGQAVWSQSFVNVTPRDIKGKILRLDNDADPAPDDTDHHCHSANSLSSQPYFGNHSLHHSETDPDRNFTWVEYEFVQASTGHCSHTRKPAAETMAAEMLLALSAKP